MTKYVKTETKAVGGTQLTVMIRKGTSSAIADTTAEVLEQSRKLLEVASGIMCQGGGVTNDAIKLASHFFLTPANAIPADKLSIIQKVITKTRTGLSGDVVIKTGKILSGEKDKSTLGQVLKLDIGKSAFKSKTLSHADRTYQSFVKSLDPNESKNYYRRGAIHVSSGAMKDSIIGPVTFIHEATHKYAGTIDYKYFEDDGSKPSNFTDASQAILNADSHAWFIFTLGSRMSIS